MIEVCGQRFYECNVAFHFKRDNVYSPWTTIGVYLTSVRFRGAKYVPEYADLGDHFVTQIERLDNVYIKGGPEFLDWWRSYFQQTNDVIAPIIKYYIRSENEFRWSLGYLFSKYVGSISIPAFRMLSIMLRMKNGYFPTIFNPKNCNRKLVEALSEANLI